MACDLHEGKGGMPVLFDPTALHGREGAPLFMGAREHHLIALIWFNVKKLAKWQLPTNSTAANAFRENAAAAASGTPAPSRGGSG
jgi:hypothetical protein